MPFTVQIPLVRLRTFYLGIQYLTFQQENGQDDYDQKQQWNKDPNRDVVSLAVSFQLWYKKKEATSQERTRNSLLNGV